MPRGRAAAIGTETTNANGYVQVKTETGWVGKHTIILEKKLGRKLGPNERAIFKDGDRNNLDPDNIELSITGSQSLKGRIARLESEIADRQELLKTLKQQAGLDE